MVFGVELFLDNVDCLLSSVRHCPLKATSTLIRACFATLQRFIKEFRKLFTELTVEHNHNELILTKEASIAVCLNTSQTCQSQEGCENYFVTCKCSQCACVAMNY